MNINQLPPELLAIILKNEKITLRQRLALRVVSKHWLSTIEENVCKLTTKLELNDDEEEGDNENFRSESSLQYTNNGDNDRHVSAKHLPFTTKSIPHLIRLFPIVADLTITLKPGSPYQELPHFLAHFGATLKILKLWKIERTRLTKLLLHLSSLEHLSELGLSAAYQRGTQLSLLFSKTDRQLVNVKKLTWRIQFQPVGSFSIALVTWFPYLEQLTFETDKSNQHLRHSLDLQITSNMLKGLLPLKHLTELSLSDVDYASALVMPSLSDQLLTGVKKLNLMFIWYDSDLDRQASQIISLIIAWFPNVASLTVRFNEDIFPLFRLTTSLLYDLARLKCLTSLALPKMYCPPYLKAHSLIDGRLTALKRLDMRILDEGDDETSDDLHKVHFSSAIAAWCPHLEELTVRPSYNEEDSTGQYSRQFQLTSYMLRAFANLQYLSKLELPKMVYKREHLDAPSPTDRPLTALKKLLLKIADSPADFDGQYCSLAIATWCPRLERLIFWRHYQAINKHLSFSDKFPLTTKMLRGFGSLEHLAYLDLSSFFYSKKYIEMPLPTDRPLASLKTLTDLAIIDSAEDFDGEHFCSTLAAWCPRLESLTICVNRVYKGKAVEPYNRSIEANRHHFGSANFKLQFPCWY